MKTFMFTVRSALLAAFCFSSLVFCNAAPASAAVKLTMELGGQKRTATVIERGRLKLARRPLIIVLHSANSHGGRVRGRLGLEQAANSAKPFFVYPDAIDGHWGAAAGPAADRDLTFLRDLVARFVNEGTVDRKKIFIVGLGSGGAMAYRAACAGLGQPLAGLAILLSSAPADLAECAPTRPTAYFAIVATADPLAPFGGGATSFKDAKYDALSGDAALMIFAKAAGCEAKKEPTLIPDRDPSDGTRAFVDRFSGCKAPVEQVRIEGGGHHIPGRHHELGERERASNLGPTNNDFDAPHYVWEFLRRAGA